MNWRPMVLTCAMCGFPVLSAPSIRIVTEHLPPYQIDTPAGPRGFATEVVQAVFSEAQLSYQIEFQSWSRAYQLALRDPNVCIYSISRSAERQKLFHWIGALSYNITAIYSLSSRTDIHIQSLDDARKYTVAVNRDDITHHYLLEHGFHEGKELYLLDNVESMLHVLVNRSREIDLVLVNDTILRYRAEAAGLEKNLFRKQLELPDLPLDFHLACSLKTDKTLVSKLRSSLQKLKSDGRYQQIVGDWSQRFDDKIGVD